MPLTLEDFADSLLAKPTEPAEAIPRAQAEADRMESYETGYQAGWDDAARAEAQEQARIGAEFARNLQELSFTFHEARAHLIQAMEPLLTEMVGTVLPAMVHESLGHTILEELRPLLEAAADCPVELVVAPASRAALEPQLQQLDQASVRLTEEPSLAEGQAYLRVGKLERQIDMSEALDRIRTAIRALYDLNERTLRHA